MKTTEKARQALQEIVQLFGASDLPEAIALHGAETRLADIPLEHLPPALQETCEQFIDAWWATLDPDQLLQASGLAEMTLAGLLVYHGNRKRATAHRSGVASPNRSSVK